MLMSSRLESGRNVARFPARTMQSDLPLHRSRPQAEWKEAASVGDLAAGRHPQERGGV